MAFQSLVSGSECALPSNPLSQVLKHTEGDRSTQQDRIAGPSTSRLHHLPSTSAPKATDHDLALARQFFEGNPQGAPAGLAMPNFTPQSEFARTLELHAAGRADPSDAWLREQQQRQQLSQPNGQAAWAAEFSHAPQSVIGPSIQQNHVAQPTLQQRPSYMGSTGLYGGPMPMGAYGLNMGQSMFHGIASNRPLAAEQDKGKGKYRDADLEAAFEQAAASLVPVQSDASRIVEVDTAVDELSATLNNAKLAEMTEGATDTQSVWDELKSDPSLQNNADLGNWEEQLNHLMSEQREDLEHEFGADMQSAWERGLGDFDGKGPGPLDSDGFPVLSPYTFDASNKYLGSEHLSNLEDAKALLNQGGSLSEAALMLEAAVQQGDLGEGGYEAWILLGETRNMDEREDAGVRALMEGVKRAEASGAHGPGLLSLAISFTNEDYARASYTMLLRWLQARFPSHPIPEETAKAVKGDALWESHRRLTDVFINLARSQHQQGVMEPDVQVGLGILFYADKEYDRAKDCFETALTAKPKDSLLWNRLGSTLSNGGRPEEALSAYRQALQLRPTYTRAIYNVGVACLNIGAYEEAAEHFLSALAMQESADKQSSSAQIWSTLRRAFNAMDRYDLVDMCQSDSHAPLETFRAEGFDF